MKRKWKIALILFFAAYLCVGVAAVVLKRKAMAAPYPLDTCVVSGYPLKRPVVWFHKNKKVLFCCVGCSKKFRKDPERYAPKLDKAYEEMAKQTISVETMAR